MPGTLQTAVGHEYKTELHKHASQTDAVKGFGGKFGVQKDRQDKAAADWSYKEKLEKHASQKGKLYSEKKKRVVHGRTPEAFGNHFTRVSLGGFSGNTFAL